MSVRALKRAIRGPKSFLFEFWRETTESSISFFMYFPNEGKSATSFYHRWFLQPGGNMSPRHVLQLK